MRRARPKSIWFVCFKSLCFNLESREHMESPDIKFQTDREGALPRKHLEGNKSSPPLPLHPRRSGLYKNEPHDQCIFHRAVCVGSTFDVDKSSIAARAWVFFLACWLSSRNTVVLGVFS